MTFKMFILFWLDDGDSSMHYYKTFKAYSIAIWKQDQTLASDPKKYVRDKKWSQGKVRNHCGMKIQNPRFCYLSSMYMDIKCFVFRWILKRYSHLLLLPQLPWYNIFLFVFFVSFYIPAKKTLCCEFTEVIVLVLYPPHRFLFVR